MMMDDKAKQRFYNNIDALSNLDCHLWTRGNRFQYKNKSYGVQKFAWMIFNNSKVPYGYVVKSSCGKELCVYSGHLYLSPKEDSYISKESLQNAFWSRVNKTPYCWEWTGVISGNGYGRLNHHRKKYGAHRLSWIINYGDIPSGMMVCHKCDNPICVNPNHLFLGTNQDNQIDSVNKGRKNSRRGENAYNSKLSTDDIKSIRSLRSDGRTLQYIGNLYNLGFQYVSKIINRKVWKHVI